MADVNYALASLGAVASSSGAASGHGADLAIDGNDVTWWQSSHSLSLSPWLAVDLGAPQYITYVSFLNGNAPNGSVQLNVRASVDGVNWSVITGAVVVAGENVIQVGGSIYRHWQIYDTGAGSAAWYVYSFRVYGPAEAPPNPETPMCDQITAWLDSVETNFVPCVEDWLAANP